MPVLSFLTLHLQALVVDAQERLALRTAEIHGLAGRRPGPTSEVGDNLPHLSRSRDAVTICDGLSNSRHLNGPRSIIEGTINPRDVSLLRINPFQETLNLIERQGRDEATRQIHMDFIWATMRVRAEFSHSMSSIRPDPG